MGYFIIFLAITFIFYKTYQGALAHDSRFAAVEEAKVKGMIAELRVHIGEPDFENRVKVFLNDLEASMLTHRESVELMIKEK